MTSTAHHEAINLTSLNLVREELIATIERAVVQLEGFIDNQENTELLQSCIGSLEQIRGSLALVQLYGASELANEMLVSANDILTDDLQPLEESLSVLTHSFFNLSRYFEYVLRAQRAMPALMVPYINDIRIVCRKPLMSESHFFEVDFDANPLKDVHKDPVAIDNDEQLATSIGRLRHMYEVGLLGVFKQVNVKSSIGLMHRAIARIAALSGDYKSGAFWHVAAVAISLFDSAGLEITRERKRNLGYLDRQLKQILNNGLAQFDQAPATELWRDFIYYIALSGVDNDLTKATQSLYGYTPLSYDERKRRSEQKALIGPNASTVSSLVSTLQEELRSIKEIIEIASGDDDESESKMSITENYQDIADRITKIKEILNVVGLESASTAIEQQLEKLKQWKEDDRSNGSSQLLEIADALIYVETMLNDLEKLNFSDEKLKELNNTARREMIASSQFAEAQLVVFKEVEEGLSSIKKSLNAFNDSEFDNTHIVDVPATLDSIRGGMILLERPRAAAIIAKCAEFIEKSLLVNEQPSALEQVMDTFADALSGLEYYMECLRIDSNTDDSILVISEESLTALGYSIENADN